MNNGLFKKLILTSLLGIGAVSFGITTKSALEASAKKPGSDTDRGTGTVYTQVKTMDDFLSSSTFIFCNSKNSKVANGEDTNCFSSTSATFTTSNNVKRCTTTTTFTFDVKFINDSTGVFSLVSKDNKYVSITSSGVTLEDTQSSSTQLTVTFNSNGESTVKSGNYGIFFNKQSSTFVSAQNGNKHLIPELYTIQADEEKNFVDEFNSSITCDKTGATTPTFAEGKSWDTLKSAYQSLSFTEKNKLSNGTYEVTGTSTSTVVTPLGDITNAEAQVLYLYDYIVAKYGWENFMDRPGSINALFNPTSVKQSGQIATTVVSGLIGLTCIGGFFYVKRRKFN